MRTIELASALAITAAVGFASGWLNAPPQPPQCPRPSPEPHVYPSLAYDARPAPPIPSLRSFLGANDAETAQNARAWFTAHEGELSFLWQEPRGDKLLGWYGMMLVHLALPYGVGTVPEGLKAFVNQGTAACDAYAAAQDILYRAWGLKHRVLRFDNGWHGWVEVDDGGHWEVFDATTALWFDVSMQELVERKPRHFRRFYSPMEDGARPDARAHLAGGVYDAPLLRATEVCLGLCDVPTGNIVQK